MPDAWVPPRYTAIRAFCRVSLLNPFSVLLLGNIKFFALEVMLKRSRCGMGEMLYYEINRASEEVVLYRPRLFVAGDGTAHEKPTQEAEETVSTWRNLVYDVLYGQGYVADKITTVNHEK